MNYRQVEVFAMIMKAGTASHAAELLNISQPAVSRSLAEFEAEIGFPLFDRVRNRLVPTPEAKLFYRDVETSFRGMDTLRASAAWIRDRGAGEIRLACRSALSSSIVPKAISGFHAAYPDVKVTLHVLWSRDVRDRVASGQCDVGLAADEIDVAGIHHQKFLSHRALCAIPLGHSLCDHQVIGPQELEGQSLINYVPEDRLRKQIDHVFAQAGVTPNNIVETIYASTVCALVSSGVGVGFVTTHAVAGVDESRFVLRPFEPAVSMRSLLIMPSDRQKSQHLRAFINCLLAAR
ncbi:LysR substrate-binding domain-containing protein [Nitratireductor sp.]|uniref:LysR substrate-binding domain-containing protein n=1 Tax=Nitratireductor sp. TaxID=1872084 RepID=UPI002639453C|nr:LysR substrate-binding domain-containing protein [Nitratireductor sp.]MCV0378345.1 LysR family transcriptional regulator [Nitratireductor sp.]